MRRGNLTIVSWYAFMRIKIKFPLLYNLGGCLYSIHLNRQNENLAHLYLTETCTEVSVDAIVFFFLAGGQLEKLLWHQSLKPSTIAYNMNSLKRSIHCLCSMDFILNMSALML